jgi:hypothetical protein
MYRLKYIYQGIGTKNPDQGVFCTKIYLLHRVHKTIITFFRWFSLECVCVDCYTLNWLLMCTETGLYITATQVFRYE